MGTSSHTRRGVLRSGAVGIGLLCGCVEIVDDDYVPGTVEVRNTDERRHSVSLTLYRYDAAVWSDRGRTPVREQPEFPDEEPSDTRRIPIDVAAGTTERRPDQITAPFCGPIVLCEARVESGGRSSYRFNSMCGYGAPEDVSNVHLMATIDGDGMPRFSSLDQEPGAA